MPFCMLRPMLACHHCACAIGVCALKATHAMNHACAYARAVARVKPCKRCKRRRPRPLIASAACAGVLQGAKPLPPSCHGGFLPTLARWVRGQDSSAALHRSFHCDSYRRMPLQGYLCARASACVYAVCVHECMRVCCVVCCVHTRVHACTCACVYACGQD